MQKFKRALLAGAIGLALSTPAAAQFTASYFFGDSLTDTGYYKPVLPPGTGLFTTNPGPVWATVFANRLGTTANPMSRDQLVAKCRDLMAPVIGAPQTTRLIDRVLAVEKASNIRELRPLLQRANKGGTPKLSEYPNAK